jgi:hypothetical protein
VTISTGNIPARDDGGPWVRRPDAADPGRIDGYHVQAVDGPVGEVIASCDEPGRGYVIVAVDRPLADRGLSAVRTVMLPAGLIERIDPRARLVSVGATLAHIGDAPAFENDRYQDRAYRAELDAHYGSADGFGQAATG